MKNALFAFFTLITLGLGLSSCGSGESKTAENTTLPQDTVKETTVPALSPVLDPNLASEEELKSLPHFTPELAKTIMENRPILSITQLNELIPASLDSAARAGLYVRLFVPINLNTASREEILMVPGVGRRMAHEFEEYRPYTNPAQFQKEMGKYVDPAEVARFEQYVFVPVELNTASDEHIMTIPGLGKRMLHEFKEYRPYKSMEQFNREIGKYVDERELARLGSYVYLSE